LAKLRADAQITQSGSTVGTAAYMSPEQIRGEEIDARSDIFSFGIVLFELTTGRLPFRGEHAAAVSYSIVNDDPTPLGPLRPNVPPGLASVIAKCLAKEKDKRYQKCDDIVEDLRVLRQQPSGESSGHVAAVATSSRRIWIAAAAVAVLAGGALLYAYVINPATAANVGQPTIAVLYLENMTDNTKYDSFAAGMTEEIINELSNVPGLKVVSRNDVVQFRGKPADIDEIGKKLKVGYVLEGSVRWDGKRVRITTQAIQTQDRFHFWSQGYTRELTNTLDVQSEVAQQVAQALKSKFKQKDLEEKLGLPTNTLLKQ
jgi:TolB-like protein